MERSALLSHPPSSESNPDDSEQVSAGQSRRSPVSPEAAEVREPEASSQPEQERLTRPEQRPPVEGCVDTELNSESVKIPQFAFYFHITLYYCAVINKDT